MTSSGDRSNGYESTAPAFIRARVTARIGENTIREWAQTLTPGTLVLDLGCGCGIPVAETLLAYGCKLHAIDASPAMVEAFQQRFPSVHVQCADVTVDEPGFFELQFDAVVAWGLLFLLTTEQQTALIARVARALRPGGRFLFTAPAPACEWNDVLTGRKSISLGRSAYAEVLKTEGFTLDAETLDEGDNHYYWATRQMR